MSNRVVLSGSERQPVGSRVSDQPADEIIEVSVILEPRERAPMPLHGGATVTRESFATKYGADSADIERVKRFATEYQLAVTEVSMERRTVKLEGTVAN